MFLQFPHFYLWDFIILTLLLLGLSCSIGAVVFLYKKSVHKIISGGIFLFLVLTATCTISLFYAAFIEPYSITVTNKTIALNLPEPISIAIFSDTHVRPGKNTQFLQKVVSTVNTLSPDIIIIPGDFIFAPTVDFSSLIALKELEPSIKTYAVLGNHDQGYYTHLTGKQYVQKTDVAAIVELLESANISVLRNQSDSIQYGRNSVQVTGIDDLWSNTSSLEKAHETINTTAFTILVSHNPSIITHSLASEYNLVISGHTHGGQVRLPFIGPVPELPTTLGSSFDQGIFTLGENNYLAITRGVGESEARTRFLAPPEILLLTVK